MRARPAECSRLPGPFHGGVRRLLLLLSIALSTPLLAIDVDPKLDHAVRGALPLCPGAKVTYGDLPVSLPQRFTGTLVLVESPRPSCAGQYAAILSPTGGFYLGMPWPIDTAEGKTIQEKLKSFAWTNMQENVKVTVDRTRTDDGLWNVTMESVTENGDMPMHGAADPDGKVFFMGHFRRLDAAIPAQRSATLEKFAAGAPSKGPADAPVTIVEFSDFQCPSCRRTTGFADQILARHASKVRYVRFDLPLTGHPWAFPAALAGRAIWRQKPDLFWDYKKAVYENQENLNTFTFWDWARGFAEDHDLDLARYDADLGSADLRKEILSGAGAALSNDVRATPTFMVNGTMVDYGDDGKALAEYIDELLK